MSDAAIKIPKTLGARVDRLYQIKAELSELARAEEALRAERKALVDSLVNELPKNDAQGVAGKLARATIVTKVVPTVKDWPAFYAYVLKTKDFSLMQKRVADGAVRERWDNGKQVPGVEQFTHVDVSLNKI
jgi:hypothetical protein